MMRKFLLALALAACAIMPASASPPVVGDCWGVSLPKPIYDLRDRPELKDDIQAYANHAIERMKSGWAFTAQQDDKSELDSLLRKVKELEAKIGGGEKVGQPKVKDAPVHGRGYKLPPDDVRAARHAAAFARHDHKMGRLVKNSTPPPTWDSSTLGWIPPIRDQGQCGDCFGVSASDALTVAYIKAGYQKADGSFVIAEQYGLDCGAYPGGCNGGDGPEVYAIMKSKGFPAERYVDDSGKTVNDYPGYTARPSSCRLKSGAKMWKCDWGYVTSDQSDRAPTVAEVKAGIMQYGTVTFAFDASAIEGYSSGVITRLGRNIDHEITGFMGWDDSKSVEPTRHDRMYYQFTSFLDLLPTAQPKASKGAFKCRNQWGKDFGEAGYFWLAYDALPAVVEACFLYVAPVGPTPSPITVAVADVSVQAGQPATFLPLATGGTSPYTFAYDYGDGTHGTSSQHVYMQTGSFKVTVTATDSKQAAGTGYCTATVTETPPPPPVPGAPKITLSKDIPAGDYFLLQQATGNMRLIDLLSQSQPAQPVLSPAERQLLQQLLDKLKGKK